jgi:hypothetical protein
LPPLFLSSTLRVPLPPSHSLPMTDTWVPLAHLAQASDENAFFGLKVPEGTDRRELYKSQYRAIYTYKMSAGELDQAFREAVTGDGPDGGWSIKNDERVKYVGKLEVQKGEDSTLKVTMEDYPEAGMSALKYYTIQSYTK